MYVYHKEWRVTAGSLAPVVLVAAAVLYHDLSVRSSYSSPLCTSRGATTSECNLIWRDSNAIGGVDTTLPWGGV